MPSIVQEILEVTQQLKNQLEKNPNDQEQDQYITSINELLNKREDLLKGLPKEYTEQEKALGRTIVQLNRDVDVLLQRFFSEIQKDLRQAKNNKMVFNKYQQRSFITADGMFFDKRK